MQLIIHKTRLSVTFPFSAVVMLMLLFCDSETVLVSLASSLLHEAGHLFFMFKFHSQPSLICFGAFGIRIERQNTTPLSAEKEALVALGGIIVNMLLALFGAGAYLLFESAFGIKLALVNGFIGCFNMLPCSLLDFGRFLECMLSSRPDCEALLRLISHLTMLAVAAGCLLYNIFIGINVSMIAVSIYIILITTLKE